VVSSIGYAPPISRAALSHSCEVLDRIRVAAAPCLEARHRVAHCRILAERRHGPSSERDVRRRSLC